MSNKTSLSGLCSICHVIKYKYRCPGCLAQTCSSPCYQKHKQRASCSGKRNPAAFVKKSQLTTAAGIDRDYNYLRSIETSIERANRDISERGVGKRDIGPSVVNKNIARGRNEESALQRYLIEHQITIDRAPVGMTRQRINLTRPTKRNLIAWTVEWIDVNGDKVIQHDCIASMPVAYTYDVHLAALRNAASGTKKRKRAAKTLDASCPQPPSSADLDPPHDPTTTQSTSQQNPPPPISPSCSSPSSPAPTPAPPTPHPPGRPRAASLFDFYLVRPLTASKSTILVPIPDSTTSNLTDVLKGRTVLEFPTLVILPAGQDLALLQGKYRLEEEYEADGRRRALSSTTATTKTTTTASPHPPNDRVAWRTGASTEQVIQDVGADQILEMLKRDLGRTRGR